MAVSIYQRTALSPAKGFYRHDQACLPAEALDSFTGIWQQRAIFLNSPLADKVLCVAILNCSAGTTRFTPEIERFLQLCAAAGAFLVYYDGGGRPAGDVILALETGTVQVGVKYLGAAFRSRPLARNLAAKLKTGLELAYLPDPVAFDRPHYNLRLKLWSRLFTPALAISWPPGLDLAPWLFASLMEHAGGGSFDAAQLALAKPPSPTTVAAEASEPPPPADPVPAAKTVVESTPPAPPDPPPTPAAEKKRRSASLSRVAYPEFSAAFEPKQIKKKPFT